jgi:hypothetical protein
MDAQILDNRKKKPQIWAAPWYNNLNTPCNRCSIIIVLDLIKCYMSVNDKYVSEIDCYVNIISALHTWAKSQSVNMDFMLWSVTP